MSARTPRATATGTLVITNWRDLDHPEAGGAEVVCQQLATQLAARGQAVVLLCATVTGRPATEARDGYHIVRRGGRFTVYAYALLWLLRHRGEVSAVLDSQNGIPFFTPLAVRARTPVVMLLHHVHQDQFARYFSRPVAALGRWLESTASRAVYGSRGVLAVSPSTRTDARRRLRLRGEIWVAPPGWSTVPPADRPARTSHPSIVCVGRLVPHKRTELIIEALPEALRHYPDARLTIVGRGPEAEMLSRRARELGVDGAVEFRADLSDEGRDRLLSTAWFSIHASQGEGWGLSVIEANALGVPVLAFRRPGLRDSIVDGETGWLIDDDENLSEAMVTCIRELADAGHAARFAESARQWADRFTWDAMAIRVVAAFEAEKARLTWGRGDRRLRSDAATVVTVASQLMSPEWRTLVRDTDVLDERDGQVTVLCRGADTQTVQRLLDRLGVDPHHRGGPAVVVAVARPSDLLRVRATLAQSGG